MGSPLPHSHPPPARAARVLAGAVASGGALALGALTPAGAANATCVSVDGFDNGGGCTSTIGTIALAIGSGATASATAIGNAARAEAVGGNHNTATVIAGRTRQQSVLGMDSFMWSTINNFRRVACNNRFMQHCEQ